MINELDDEYSICVIDIGSPKLGNLGWCLIDCQTGEEHSGFNLDELFPHFAKVTKNNGLILGLEAPLFVPLRKDLMVATRARKGEGKRPWSAGAGAQVLVINLPIMVYLFEGIQSYCPNVSYCLNEDRFTSKPQQIMLFEALVSGADKGSSHINDAQIMARNCVQYSEKNILPISILQHEDNTDYFNLAAAALLRCGLEKNISSLNLHTPIYKPTREGVMKKE